MTYPSQTPEGRRDYREQQKLEKIAEQTRMQVRGDHMRNRIRLDLVVGDDNEVLARVYMNYERAHKLMAAIGRAVVAR